MSSADSVLGDITEDGYYTGVWFLAGVEMDWLAIVRRDPDGVLCMAYRFRYYANKDSRDPFDGADHKSSYQARFAGKTEDELIAIVDSTVDRLVRDNFCGTRLPWKVSKRRYRVLVRGDGKAFGKAILNLPFVHWKKTS